MTILDWLTANWAILILSFALGFLAERILKRLFQGPILRNVSDGNLIAEFERSRTARKLIEAIAKGGMMKSNVVGLR